MTKIPEQFKAHLVDHFGEEIGNRVWQGYHLEPTISVRLNINKPTDQFKFEKRVGWSEVAYSLDTRPEFALDPRFHAGCYYVQDSSSMILEAIIRKLKQNNSIQLALDLCAAPGGKSLILSDILGSDAFVISNEIDGKRNAILSEVMMKWGIANHGITQLSSAKWRESGILFDLVLVDAPCSGEGMFRKDQFAVGQWDRHLVNQCSAVQQILLEDACEMIKEGGFIIYSTCTTNKIENENKVIWLLENGFESAIINIEEHDNYLVPALENDKVLGYYLLPGISSGEGLFIAVLKKISSSPTKKFSPLRLKTFPILELSEGSNKVGFNSVWKKGDISYGVNLSEEIKARINGELAFKSLGLPAYEVKGKDVIPWHGIAMHPSAHPDITLDHKRALDFVRKQTVSLPEFSKRGWYLVGFQERPLGWIKSMQNRINNYYPIHFRLRI